MSNNKIIIAEVRAALNRDPGVVHPKEVAVSERAGTVTLRGSVGSSTSCCRPDHQRDARR